MVNKKQVQTASGINVAAAVWMIISPFVLGFTAMYAVFVNNVILGIAIGILAAVRISIPESRTGWLSMVNVILGLWLIISPFTLSGVGMVPLWNNIILGIVVVVMAGMSASASAQQKHTSHMAR
jgi:hypothetical protein